MLALDRARMIATSLAVEGSALGIATGAVLAGWATAAVQADPSPWPPGWRWTVALLAALGSAGAWLGDQVGLGIDAEPTHVRRALAVVGTCFAALAAAGVSEGPASAAYQAAVASCAAIWLLGHGVRALAALPATQTPVADLIAPLALALVGGFAVTLLLGLLSGTLRAETSFQLGAGVATAALWASAAVGRVLYGVHTSLAAAARQGTRLVAAQGALRLGTALAALGVLVPALLVVASFAQATLAGALVGCAVLSFVGHPLRYALALARLADPDPGRPPRLDLAAAPDSATGRWSDL